MKLSIPENLTGKDLYGFLVANKSLLITEKKSYGNKHADGFTYTRSLVNNKGEIVKAAAPIPDDVTTIEVSTVINTTNWLDSHKDVHIPGLWKKSLSENKDLYLLQEHEMSFKGIITDDITAYTQRLSWKSLGLDIEGYTEALIFDNKISKNRNAFMFGEYKAGHVKNHSVGMRYVDIQLAVNDEEFKEEFAVWNKYYDSIANKQDADETGYFWAVKEAKVIEGSAVPIGSNRITPTRSVTESTKQQPETSTDDLPHQKTEAFDWRNALKETTFIKI